jgi:tetratricopeptide (TPR) repeat protein
MPALIDSTLIASVALIAGTATFFGPRYATSVADEKVRKANYRDAIKILSFVVKCRWISKQTLVDAYLCRSVALSCMSDYDRAVTDCSKALELMPNSAYAYGLRSLAKVKAMTLGTALEDADKSVSLAPRFCVGYCAKGYYLMITNRYEESLNNLNTAISLETRAPEIYLYRAQCLRLLGREADAIFDCNTAQSLNPRLTQSYCERAYNNLRLGLLELVEYDLGRADELKPDDPSACDLRARLCLAQGKPLEALEIIDAYLKIHSSAHAYFQISRAILCNAVGRPEDAERHLDDALRRDPNDLEALWHHGDTMEKLGKLELGTAEKASAIRSGYIAK